MHTSIIKLTKMGILGVVTFVLTLMITAFLTEVVGLYYLYSYVIALTTAIIINFIVNIKLVFYVNSSTARIVKYLTTLGIVFILNPLFLKILTEITHLHYLVATAFVTILSFLLKFLIYDKWVFAETS